VRRGALILLIFGGVAVGAQLPARAAGRATLAWDASVDPNVAGYVINYGVASRSYTNTVSVGNLTSGTISNLVEGTTYFFAAKAYNNASVQSDFSNEASYLVPASVNQPPTLNTIGNLTLGEDAGIQTVNLSGITSGAPNERQKLTVIALSSNPGLIPNPTVNYTSPNASGTMSFTPVTGVYGTARLIVIVTDGGASNNIVTRSFNVAVSPVNQPPTLDPINDVAVVENSGVQTVTLSGINSGATNEFQPLNVSAISSNPELIPNPTVNYTSPNSTGSLSFTPATDAFGGTIITVTVNDGQGANGTVTRSFWFGINPRVAQLSIGSTVLQAGRSGSVPVNFSSSEGVTDLSIVLDVPPGHLTNLALQALAPEINPASATIVPQAGTTALLHLAARPGQSILGFKQLAQLTFTAIANQQSAFVPLNALPFSATKAGGSLLTGRPAQSGRAVVVGQEALLEATLDASGNRGLILYGKPSSTFAIEYTTSLTSSATWTRLTSGFSLTTLATPVQLSNSSPDLVLYRAARLSAAP
jgi:hypothetical protein